MSYNNDQEHKNQFDPRELETSTLLQKIVIAVFFIILNICVFHATAQTSFIKLGGGIQLISSGNGLGAFASPYLSLNTRSHSVFAGPLFQKTDGTFRGVKVAFSKNLSCPQKQDLPEHFSEPDLFQLNVYSYGQYTSNASLCRSVVSTEQMIHRETSIDWGKVRYNTVEAGAGIEFRINLTNSISWRNLIGASAYYHLNYVKGMDHEQIAPTLNLGTGLNFIIQ